MKRRTLLARTAPALLLALAAPSLFAQVLPRAAKPEEVGLSSPRLQRLTVYFTQLLPSGGLDDHAKLRALLYQAIVDGARN